LYKGVDKSLARPGKKIYSDRRFWVSYILFIIITGGILILFLHITRLTSNEIFSPSKKIHRELGRAKDLSAPLITLTCSMFCVFTKLWLVVFRRFGTARQRSSCPRKLSFVRQPKAVCLLLRDITWLSIPKFHVKKAYDWWGMEGFALEAKGKKQEGSMEGEHP